MTKVVVITGGSSGIGLCAARALLEKGCRVYELSRRAQGADAAITHVQADVTDEAQVRAAVEEIVRREGRIDVLINNAGTDCPTWLTKLKQSEWDAVCNLNQKAVFNMSKYAIDYLKKTKGCIINTASVAGVYGSPTGLPYPASKAAVIAMTKSMAYSFAPNGVRVNCIAPGVVETDMTAGMPDFAKKSVGDTIPMKRFGQPEDIANAMMFLASSAASYVTGACLQVDGGYRPSNLLN